MNPIFTIKVKGLGDIKGELFIDDAPNTVKNFIYLANSKFYDGLTFHRVIPGFVIQAGCPKGDGTGGPSYSIKGEFKANGVENKIIHKEGVLSMARAMDKNSGGSQFFVMVGDAPHLDGQYAGFGKVTEGLDIALTIAKTKTTYGDKPVESQIIEEIRVDTLGETYGEPEKI
ncbi:MAG: peptidylprolyl isomerase [Clostridiaceae bacterium]